MAQKGLWLSLIVLAGVAFAPSAFGFSVLTSDPLKSFMPTVEQSLAHMTEDEEGSSDALQLLYHGGPVQHAPKVYLVFWGWQGQDPDGVAPYLIAFFSGVGGSSWHQTQTQYTDGSGPTGNQPNQLAGVWFDDDLQHPPVPDAFIATEAQRAVSHFGYSKDADYIIATPHLISTAGFPTGGLVGSYCAWHSTTTSASRVVAFTNLPYIPDAGGSCGASSVNPTNQGGKLDGVSIVAGHEYSEVITDPWINAWYDADGWENADKCAWLGSGPGAMRNIQLSTGRFAVQSLWSNSAAGCVQS